VLSLWLRIRIYYRKYNVEKKQCKPVEWQQDGCPKPDPQKELRASLRRT